VFTTVLQWQFDHNNQHLSSIVSNIKKHDKSVDMKLEEEEPERVSEGDPAPNRARSEARWPAPATRVWRWECPESQRTYSHAFPAWGTAWTGWSLGRVSWRAWSRGAWRRRRRRSIRRRRRRRCGGRGVGGRGRGRRRCGRRCCWRCGSRGRAPPCGTARRSGRRRRWGGCGGRARGRAWGRGGRIFRSSRGRGGTASRGG